MKKILALLFFTWQIVLSAQPVNDNYSGAYDVTSLINSCSDVGVYTTEDATADLNAASCWNTSPNYNVWFKFQAPSTGRIRVEIKRGGVYGSIREVNAAIWESDGTTEVACNRYVYEEDNVIVQSLNVTPGQWYYISVDNVQASSKGTFTLCLYDDVDYDFYEGAVDLSSIMNNCSDPGIYSTVGATPDRNAASCWNTLPNYNRWFKFQAPSTGQVKVEIKRGGSYGDIRNINVALWESDGTTEVSCKRYIYSDDNVIVQSLNLTPGQWYYISVDNASSLRRGSFTVCLNDQVDYDFYEGAYDVTSLIGSCSADAIYTTHGYTPDKNAASCWDANPTNNVWFKFQAPANGVIRVEVKRGGSYGTIRNLNVALWEQDGVTELACQRYNDRNDNIIIQKPGLTPGQWYYISVDNSNLTYSGSFTLCLDDQLDYDFYEGAYDITGLIGGCSDLKAYTTVGATPDRNAASCWDASPNYNRWFKFQAPSTGMIRIRIATNNQFGTIQNINAAIWESDGVTEVACNRYIDPDDWVVIQAVGLTPGDWYYLTVDNFDDAARGSFTLCLYDNVDYDFYEGAMDVSDIINSCSSQQAYTTKGATPDRNAGSCWDAAPYYNRWFKFTANSTQITIRVRTGGSYGTIQRINLALWDTDGVTELACARYVNPSDTEVSLQYTGLTAGNVYYFTVDNSTPDSRGSFTICLEDGTMLWTGNADTDWSNEGNWRPERVPTASDICVIPTSPEGRNFPETNSQPEGHAYDLILKPGAYVIVPNDHKLIIDNNLTLESTSARETASIIDLNSDGQIHIGGKVHIERFVVANNDYHYVSVPIPGLTVDDAFAPAVYRYYFDEPSGADNQMDGWQWASGNIEVARGYAIYATSDFMLNFDGTSLHSGTYGINVTLTDGAEISDNEGYNLIGNPYPSAIDANAFIDRNSSVIEGTLYFWNDADGDGVFEHEDYATWNGSGSTGVGGGQRPNGKIAAHQGFMVKSQVSSGTVYFENYMRDKENTQFFRPLNNVLRRIRLQVNNDRYFSETLIAFREDATEGFDSRYDGRKLASNNNLHIFTTIGQSWFAIQSLPEQMLQQGREVTIPLHLLVGSAGQYVMSVNMYEQWDGFEIVLRDNDLQIDTPLGPWVSYSFFSEAGQFDDRFEIVIRASALENDKDQILVNTLYPNPVEDEIYIHLSENLSGEALIYDLKGKELYRLGFENTNELKIPVSTLYKGVYILKLISDKATGEYQFIKK